MKTHLKGRHFNNLKKVQETKMQQALLGLKEKSCKTVKKLRFLWKHLHISSLKVFNLNISTNKERIIRI